MHLTTAITWLSKPIAPVILSLNMLWSKWCCNSACCACDVGQSQSSGGQWYGANDVRQSMAAWSAYRSQYYVIDCIGAGGGWKGVVKKLLYYFWQLPWIWNNVEVFAMAEAMGGEHCIDPPPKDMLCFRFEKNKFLILFPLWSFKKGKASSILPFSAHTCSGLNLLVPSKVHAFKVSKEISFLSSLLMSQVEFLGWLHPKT